MRIPLEKNEVDLLKLKSNYYKRVSAKWMKECLKEKEDAFARNRYEGMARAFQWVAEDLENKIKFGKLKK